MMASYFPLVASFISSVDPETWQYVHSFRTGLKFRRYRSLRCRWSWPHWDRYSWSLRSTRKKWRQAQGISIQVSRPMNFVTEEMCAVWAIMLYAVATPKDNQHLAVHTISRRWCLCTTVLCIYDLLTKCPIVIKFHDQENIYSGTPLNGHPSTADTYDITDNSESPDCPSVHFNT